MTRWQRLVLRALLHLLAILREPKFHFAMSDVENDIYNELTSEGKK